MSRAFVKEDVDVPERSNRSRSPSGLPPGALNYLTARGAARLRALAAQPRRAGKTAAAAEAERLLASATIVEPPETAPEVVIFGATVTLRTGDGAERKVRIVGVDEVDFEKDSVSWVSPLGKALLGIEAGKTVLLGDDPRPATVLKIEHG